jgi:hypothetical protein
MMADAGGGGDFRHVCFIFNGVSKRDIDHPTGAGDTDDTGDTDSGDADDAGPSAGFRQPARERRNTRGKLSPPRPSLAAAVEAKRAVSEL